MRIGIHFGKVIGGIIGSDIIRFDIYGDDVIIANKMESEGVKGKINVSESFKLFLENSFEDFSYEFNGVLKYRE